MASHEAYDQPTKTSAVDGEVTLDGPDGVAVSMTPEAAAETSRRLAKTARTATRQRDKRAERS